MLGVVTNPTFTDADRHPQGGGRRHGLRRHLRADAGRGVLRPRRRARRRARPCPTRTSAVRARRAPAASSAALHDGLPLRRQEHAAEELPRPRGNGWGGSHSDDDGDRASSSVPRAAGTSTPSAPDGGCAGRSRRTPPRIVILAAGTWGTQQLLFKMRDAGTLPELSDKLGVLTRTNSESIVGAGTARGAATTSTSPTAWRSRRRSTRPPDTHIEPCRYGKGSNAMGLLQTLMTDGARPRGHRRAAVEAVPRSERAERSATARCGCSIRGSGANAP